MIMIQRLLNIINRRIRHATTLKYLQPLLRRLRLQLIFNDPIQRIPILDSERICDKSGVGFPVRFADFIAQDSVEFIVAAADSDVGVL